MGNDDGWTETVPEPYQMPEGYLNHLTDEHWEKLYKMWDAFFSVCDRAKGTKEQQTDGFAEDWGVDTEAAKSKTGVFGGTSKAIKQSGIEKEDDAKAAAQARAEEANMEKLLSTYGPEALRNTFWGLCKRDNPDITMLRFLRARKWDVDHTTAMLASTFKWRLDTNLDSLLENGDLGNGKEIPKYVENFEENGKVFSLGTNHKNQPVMYVQFGKHIIWAQPQATTKKFIIAHFELVRLLVVPPNDKIHAVDVLFQHIVKKICSSLVRLAQYIVRFFTSKVLLFDCTGFGPSNMDILNFLYILQCLQSYFPETLSVLYLHKAPWILQKAWHMVKWLLDPVVRAKVQFTNRPEELMEEIPKEHLLKYIGGDVDVDFDWVPPQEGENDLQKNKEERKRRWDNHRRLCNQFEQVTRRWCASKGQECNEERRILAKKLRLSHFDYEPYWLGLWVHHRNGDLSLTNPGMVRWQYPMTNGDKIRQILGHEESRKSILRELREIAVGAPVDFVEARTKELLKDGSWGQWNTCDDLPSPPTGFKDGQLTYDGNHNAAALIDVIGLHGPETFAEAEEKAAQTVGTQDDDDVHPNVIANDDTSPQTQDATVANKRQSASTTPVAKPAEKQATTANRSSPQSKQANYDEKESKGSFFQSLKKKLYA